MFSTKKWNLTHLHTRRFVTVFSLLAISLFFTGSRLVSAESAAKPVAIAAFTTDQVLDAADATALEIGLDINGAVITFDTTAAGTDDGNIFIAPVTITKTGAGESTLVIRADNDITGSGFIIESTGGPLHIIFEATGAIELDQALLLTNGGDVTMTGRGHGITANTGPAKAIGITFENSVIDTTSGTAGFAGAISLDGIGNQSSRGGGADVDGNVGVMIVNGSFIVGGGLNSAGTATNDITITGVGGGLPNGDITDSADLGNYGNFNTGVVVLDSRIMASHDKAGSADPLLTPALDISGTGGAGAGNNAGVSLISTDDPLILADTHLEITGIGGGVPAAAIRQVIAAHGGANSDLIADIFSSLGENNHGVEILNLNDVNTEAIDSGDIEINGKGGNGLGFNHGIDIFSQDAGVNIDADSGNIFLNGIGGGLDAESNQGSGPSFILEDPDTDVVETLYERDLSDADIDQVGELFDLGDVVENYGVSVAGVDVSITSNYIEPSGVRDLKNNFLTGTFIGDTFTPDRTVGPDNLNINGSRHPDARHILITGKGGVGTDANSGVSISSGSDTTILSQSADINLAGSGGGIPNVYITGLIESTKDTTPFAGSDRIDTAGAIQNSTLISAIEAMYGEANNGLDLYSDDGSVTISADRTTNYPFANRTQKEAGGNVNLHGIGGTGQADNAGVWVETGIDTTVNAGIGNVNITGFGGGLPAGSDQLIGDASGDVFGIQRVGNGRADRLLEIDMTEDDIYQIIDTIWEPASRNRGVDIDALGELIITSEFQEPAPLRQFADGSYGFGTFGPADILGGVDLTDDNGRGDLVLVPSEGDGNYLLADAAGALLPVDNQIVFNTHDYSTTTANGVPVLQTRSVSIYGIGGSGDQRTEGVFLEGSDSVSIETQAAEIDIDGTGGGVPVYFTKSVIENVADVTPASDTDRTDNIFGTSTISSSVAIQEMTGGSLLDAVGDLHSSHNRGVDILSSGGDISIVTTLSTGAVWPNAVVTEADVDPIAGTSGSEQIDATIYGLGQVALEDLPLVDISGLTTAEKVGLQAMIAKATDALLVTANLNRADIKIQGIGGVGADDNQGIKFDGGGETIIQAAITGPTAFDGGNIEIVGHAGGFPAGDEYSLNRDNLVYIDENGITDNLLEVDLNSADLEFMFDAGFFDGYNEGIYIVSELSTEILSDFAEPFVPAGPGSDDWGTPVHTRQSDGDLLVARRDIRMIGNGGVGVYDNTGIYAESGDETFVFAGSANISIEGNAGGMPEIVGRHMIINGTEGTAADLHSDGTPAANDAIIAGVLGIHGDLNTGVAIRGINGVSVVSTYPIVSAPNSEVGAVRIVGNGGNGSYDNYGVDINDVSATIVSAVGNIAIVGNGGGYPNSLFTGSETGIDSFNELPGLTALDLLPIAVACECGGLGGWNTGVVIVAGDGVVYSGFDEPDIDGPGGVVRSPAYSYQVNESRSPAAQVGALPLSHSYSYMNGNRNPFFLAAGPITDATLKTGADGAVRVNRGDISEIGSNAAGREVVIAGQGGFGSSYNEGVFIEAESSFVILSVDADVDIDGKAGGAPDVIVDALFSTHDDGLEGEINAIISLLYGDYNDGVVFLGSDTGVYIAEHGNIEINGQGGEGFRTSSGIVLDGGSFIEAEQGDIFMIGEGGGVLETFASTFDSIALTFDPTDIPVVLKNPTRSTTRTSQGRAPQAPDDLNEDGSHSSNIGIVLIGDSIVASYFDAQEFSDPYQVKTDAVVLLNGTVGNNAGSGIDEAGEGIDIDDPSYEPDLGDVLTDDPGIWIDFDSVIFANGADIDLFAAGDLLIRGTSGITTTNGDLAIVATRHLEVSEGSVLNSQAADSLTTVAWDLLDPSADSLGRLKVDATSSIGAGDGAGELRLYGYRRGSNPQPYGTNSQTAAPYGQSAAYNNEIDPAALFNGVAWTNVQVASPADNSGNYAAEFETWNQEQWATPFDDTGRTALAGSDRFGGMVIPSTYDFGNPGVYTGDVTFYYGQMPTVTLTIDPLVGSEADQTVITVTVSLSLPAGSNASVDLSSGGTATSGIDYTALTSPVTFALGQTEATLVFTIIDDTLFDPDETVTLALSNAIQLLLESPMTTTVTIVDDDLALLFLPLISDQFVVASDLVVESITTTGGVLQVTIQNQGNGPVLDSFWVDLFVNPSTVPTQANDMLEQLGSMGLVWGIGGDQLPLAPGASLVLTVDDASFDRSRSHLSGGIPAGATLYGHVDSWNGLSADGAIYERHEQNGADYNNILASTAIDSVSLPTYKPGVTRSQRIFTTR